MNMIKRLFPKYETKEQLRNKISFLEGMKSMSVLTLPRNTIQIRASIQIEEGAPVEFIKHRLCM